MSFEEFEKLIMLEDELRRYSYPMPDPLHQTRREALNNNGRALTLQTGFAPSYECYRCGKEYQVDGEGKSLASFGICRYHHRGRRAVKVGNKEMKHRCCWKSANSEGCSENRYHVHEDQPLLQNYSGYKETKEKPFWTPEQHGVYALDCEMCYTVYGKEVVKVAVVDDKHKLVYEKLIKPTNIVLDYFPLYSGVTESTMKDVKTTLADVQRDLLELFSNKSILVGHSLDNDLKALKLFHKRVIDTSYLYPHRRGLPYKLGLRTLAKRFLEIQMAEVESGRGHDSSEDAIVAMRLAKKRLGSGRLLNIGDQWFLMPTNFRCLTFEMVD